jgi:hypothetical protein
MLICVGCRRYREQMGVLRTLCREHPAHADRPSPKEDTP